MAVHLHHAQKTLTGLVGSVIRASENEPRELLVGSFDAIFVANDKITKQLSAAIERMAVHLYRGQDALAGLVRTFGDKPRRLQEAVRARESQLPKLLASSFDAVVVTNVDRSLVAANPIARHLFGVSDANVGGVCP
jgi:PAS domain-containing protein